MDGHPFELCYMPLTILKASAVCDDDPLSVDQTFNLSSGLWFIIAVCFFNTNYISLRKGIFQLIVHSIDLSFYRVIKSWGDRDPPITEQTLCNERYQEYRAV